MRLLDALGRRPFAAAAVAGVALGALVGLFLPIRAAQPPKSQDDGWNLPPAKTLQRHDPAAHNALRAAPFWGATESEPGAQTAAWSLGGIVTRPVLRAAVIVTGKSGLVWVRLGEALPDGSTLVAANRDTVWYEKDGCRRARTLYRKPSAESGACIGAPGKPAASTPGKAAVPPPAALPARNSH